MQAGLRAESNVDNPQIPATPGKSPREIFEEKKANKRAKKFTPRQNVKSDRFAFAVRQQTKASAVRVGNAA